MKNPTRLNCSEAAELCTKKEYKACSFTERLKLKLHLFLCRTCSEYNQKNAKLSRLLKNANYQFCSPEEKTNLKKKLRAASGSAEKK